MGALRTEGNPKGQEVMTAGGNGLTRLATYENRFSGSNARPACGRMEDDDMSVALLGVYV